MNKLQENDRVALTLFYLKELSLKEMEEVLNCDTQTLKVRLFRARKKMKVALNQLLKSEVNELY